MLVFGAVVGFLYLAWNEKAPLHQMGKFCHPTIDWFTLTFLALSSDTSG